MSTQNVRYVTVHDPATCARCAEQQELIREFLPSSPGEQHMTVQQEVTDGTATRPTCPRCGGSMRVQLTGPLVCDRCRS